MKKDIPLNSQTGATLNIFKFISSDILAKAISVLGIFLFANIMGPEELGKFGEWFTYFNLFSIAISFGLPSYILLCASKKRGRLKSVFTLSLFINAFALLFYFMLGYFFLSKEVLSLILASAFFYNVFLLVQSVLMVAGNAPRYFFMQSSYAFLGIMLPVAVMYGFDSFESEMRVIGFFFSTIIVFVFSLVIVRRLFSLRKVDFSRFSEMLRFGLPLSLLAGVSWFKQGADIYLLSHFQSYELTGKFFFAFQVIGILTILGASLNKHFKLTFFGCLNRRDYGAWFRVILGLTGLMFLVYLTLCAAMFFLTNSFLVGYKESMQAVVVLGFGAIFYICAQFISSYYLFLKSTYFITVFSVITAVLHFACSYGLLFILETSSLEYSSLFSNLLFFFLMLGCVLLKLKWRR